LILLDVLTGRDGQLYEDNLSDPLRVLSQEKLECVKLLWYALDIVESVYTDDDLDAVKSLFKGSDALLDDPFF